MDKSEFIQMQARAYLKGANDILVSFDEAATIMIAAGVTEEVSDFLEAFAVQMRSIRAQILNEFEGMGVNVDGLGW